MCVSVVSVTLFGGLHLLLMCGGIAQANRPYFQRIVDHSGHLTYTQLPVCIYGLL